MWRSLRYLWMHHLGSYCKAETILYLEKGKFNTNNCFLYQGFKVHRGFTNKKRENLKTTGIGDSRFHHKVFTTQTEIEHAWVSLLQSPRPESQISMERARLCTLGIKCQRNLRNSPGRNCWKLALSGSGANGRLCWNAYQGCMRFAVFNSWLPCTYRTGAEGAKYARGTSGQEPAQRRTLEVKYLFFLCCSPGTLWPNSTLCQPTKYKYLKGPALFSEEEKRVHLELR